MAASRRDRARGQSTIHRRGDCFFLVPFGFVNSFEVGGIDIESA